MQTAGALLAGVLVVATTVVGSSTADAAPADTISWSPPLTGETAGVTVSGGAAQLSPDRGQVGSARADGHGDAGAPGLLTLPARPVDVPVDRVDAVLTLAPGASGAAASLDVRGLRPGGGWTEWEPAEPSAGAPTLTAALPVPVVQVQARLVLGPVRDAADPGPVVRNLTLTARPAARPAATAVQEDPKRYRVFATREGLVGGTTANGHVITERDLFVALPSRRALSPRNTSDYSVKVCAPTGRCATVPVWDVGPWNTATTTGTPPASARNGATCPQGCRRPRPRSRRGTTAARTGSAAR